MSSKWDEPVLAYLGASQFSENRTASDIGRGVGVTRQRAFVVLRDCEGRGLVRKQSRRRTGGLWELTPDGRAVLLAAERRPA